MAAKTSALKVQQRLIELGFDPGTPDGIWGRRTIAALRHFQESQGLKTDGILGPKSHAALFLTPPEGLGAATGELPWMAEATRLIRTKEFLGQRNNPAILNWADDLNVAYADDEVPWCGLFVGHCIASTLPSEPLPAAVLRARAWEKFGEPTTPRLGAVMVFWRGSEHSGKGHVGFYVGEDQGAYRVLGGNQSDSVCYAWISERRFITAMWPASARSLHKFASTIAIPRDVDLASAEA